MFLDTNFWGISTIFAGRSSILRFSTLSSNFYKIFVSQTLAVHRDNITSSIEVSQEAAHVKKLIA